MLPLATLMLALADCAEPANAPPTLSGKPAAEPSAAASLASATPQYRMPTSMCAVAGGFEAFADLYPSAKALVHEGKTLDSPILSSGNCAATLGDLPAGFLLYLAVEVYRDQAHAQTAFKGFKGVMVRTYAVVEVTGMGTDAYFYSDATLGRRLVVQHANLNFEVRIAKLGGSATIPADAQDRLGKLAHDVMSAMPKA